MNSVNLLPLTRKRFNAVNRYAGRVRFLFTTLTISLLLVFSYAFTQRMATQQSLETAEKKASQKTPESERYDLVAAQAKDLSAQAKEYYDLVRADNDFGNIFIMLKQALPPNAQLASLNSSSSGPVIVVSLAGVAADQKAVGVFREKLLDNKVNSELQINVSSVTIDSIAATGNESGAYNFTMRVTLSYE